MKRAVFLYNAQSGKGRIKRNVERICDIFREAEYDLEPVPIDFDANPFDGREEIGLMVVAGGDGQRVCILHRVRTERRCGDCRVAGCGGKSDERKVKAVRADAGRSARRGRWFDSRYPTG